MGGGGSSGQESGQLAFRLVWQQRDESSAAASRASARETVTASSTEGSAAGFAGSIPPSVSAIRFIITPSDAPGDACCVAVLRGSNAFEQRSIVIDGLLAGDITLDVSGYPEKRAPDDGIARTCSTTPSDPGIVGCSGAGDLWPSYGSDPVGLSVLPGQVSDAGNISLYSLPFLIDLEPPPGGNTESTTPLLRLSVVDAAASVDPGLEVSIDQDSGKIAVNADQMTPCNDRVAEQECSPGGALDVTGFAFAGHPVSALDAGAATVRVLASNQAEPPRSLDATYDISVGSGTTTTSSTSSTIGTTSTTLGTTSTTIAGQTCAVRFALLTQEVAVTGLLFNVDYANAAGSFSGSGSEVACRSLVTQDTALAAFNDEDAQQTLSVAMVVAPASFVAGDLVECDFVASQIPEPADFAVTVVEAVGPDNQPLDVSVGASTIQCE